GFTIAKGVTIENAYSGGGDDRLTGNDADNILHSGGGRDILVGGRGRDLLDGGGGADRMDGGTSADIYIVNHRGDVVIERPFSGIDTVKSSVSFRLGDNVENLVLTGTANLTGRGNSVANEIAGNRSDNVLVGFEGDDVISGGAGNDRIYGGSGQDKLSGGEGSDRFYFTDAPGVANADQILDFTRGQDRIHLARYAFSGVGEASTVNKAMFALGTEAHDASDRIIYDQATGRIFYDADGTGELPALLFATVTPGTVLTPTSFEIYG
ncbi:MAG TPA: M10 family metallopeptidase C-terminal domain-containing protein, partial [Allosphingosinicella sp.]|nr:M10 family metallopeptidase C-terminal domain-containing protein [Allosphingosinicella sp.]